MGTKRLLQSEAERSVVLYTVPTNPFPAVPMFGLKPRKKLMSESTSRVFEVQTLFFNGDWENVWTTDDEPQYFDTREEAQAAIDEFIADTVASPDIEDYDPEDYRVVEVEA